MKPILYWSLVLILTILVIEMAEEVQGKNPYAKYCDNMDLSGFCVIGNHFRQVVYDENLRGMRYYTQFEQIVTTFFPPFWDVTATGEVKPWPWIQDNQDDMDYSRGVQSLLESRAIKVRTGATSQTTGAFVQGYRFNLYSANDLCSLDKLYSPVYKLGTFQALGSTQVRQPKSVIPPGSPASTSGIRDLRMYYACGAYQPFPTSPGPFPLPTCTKNRDSFTGSTAFEQFMENPFNVKVTEVKHNGRRLHNYLHFEIGYSAGVIQQAGRGPAKTNLPPAGPGTPAAPPAGQHSVLDGIAYAFLIVHDQNGWPIGDFNTGVPCGTCQGKCNVADKCHQAEAQDAIPCMFLSKDAVTHPGQMMFYFPTPMAKIHATWRFSQSSGLRSFVREIHIKTLLVLKDAEKTPMVLVRDGRTEYKNSSLERLYKFYDCNDRAFKSSFNNEVPQHCYWHAPKYGVFGWNAKYPILYPSFRTLGGWDFLNPRFVREGLFDCHARLNVTFYSTEDYPVYGKSRLDGDVLDIPKSPKWKVPHGLGPSLIMGSKSEIFQGLTLEPSKFFTGLVDEEDLKLIDGRNLETQKYLPKDRAIPVSLKSYVETQKELSRLKKLEAMEEEERCICARFGTIAPPPWEQVPPIQQLDGRRDHSIQMTIAWMALVPFAIFVSRYYKETYSKVFFLQEFWWYTIHVLSFFLAGVFMIGGIYAIEIKRVEPFNWEDKKQVTHAIIGSASVFIFIMHLLLGSFRLKNFKRRRIQILLHWFFGIANYFLALVAMLVAAFIKSGCMGCPTLIVTLLWIIIQLAIYIVMEIHMRIIDKQLNLNPKRSYLPPPVMRLFHKDAPGSKFRIKMLLVFGSLSTLFYATMHFTIEFGPPFRSCFNVDQKLEATQEQYIRLI